jgi:hypothetical protein
MQPALSLLASPSAEPGPDRSVLSSHRESSLIPPAAAALVQSRGFPAYCISGHVVVELKVGDAQRESAEVGGEAAVAEAPPEPTTLPCKLRPGAPGEPGTFPSFPRFVESA